MIGALVAFWPWLKGIWGQAKTWAAIAAVVVALLAASNVTTYLLTDKAAYARGVRDKTISTISATEMLNAALRAARAKTTNAALDFEIQRRDLTELERRLADERAKDPLGDGSCISDAGWVRYFSIRP